MLRPLALPSTVRFLMVSLLAAVPPVAASAMRMTELKVVVFEAVLRTVRLRFVPAVFGLSPSIVTLLAPLSWMTPKPPAGLPLTETPSVTGRSRRDVYDAEPAPLPLRVAGVVPSIVLELMLMVPAP